MAGELLEGDNKYNCSECTEREGKRVKVVAEKSVVLKTLPPFLLLHLKRFRWDKLCVLWCSVI
jgi:ubiquitin C-terminal hydrolase